MKLRVELTDVADMEVKEAVIKLISYSPEFAGEWQEGLEAAIESLTEMPRRCRLAPEDDLHSAEIRQLLYRSHRVLFTLVDTDNDGEEDTVRILHVRHGARRYLGEVDDNPK